MVTTPQSNRLDTEDILILSKEMTKMLSSDSVMKTNCSQETE